MSEVWYIYNWANSHERKLLKGQRCKIIKIGKMNSALVRFENGIEAIISRRALKKEKP